MSLRKKRLQELYPLMIEISMALKELKCNRLVEPPMPKKNGCLTEKEVDPYCRYHQAKGHHTDDYRILKSFIEVLIYQGQLKNFVAYKMERTHSRNIRESRTLPPPPPRYAPRENKGTINMTNEGLTSGGKSSNNREGYDTHISMKRHRGSDLGRLKTSPSPSRMRT